MMRMTDIDGWVAFVGAGPGDDGLLTMRAVRLLAAGTAKVLAVAAKAGQLAVRLFPGDPLLSGAAAEVQACAKAKARFEIVPGVASVTGMPAYAGIALTGDAPGELRIIHAN